MAASPRELLAGALSQLLTPEQLNKLIDEVLAIEKKARAEFTCKHCGRRQIQFGTVSDAKAVALALPDLLNQAYGRPSESAERSDPVQFKRLTLLESDEDLNKALTELAAQQQEQEAQKEKATSSSPSNGGAKTA